MTIRHNLFAIVASTFLSLFVSNGADARGNDAIRVMTRNQYLGADLTPIILAQSPGEFLLAAQTALAQIAANNFPRRAEALAREVRFHRPDVIGLQRGMADLGQPGFQRVIPNPSAALLSWV